MTTFLLTDGEFSGLIHTLRAIQPDTRIIGFCSSLSCAHSAMLDGTYVAPDYDAPQYLTYLKQILKTEQVDYVFPVGTMSLDWFAENRAKIEEGTDAKVLTPSAETIRISNDKCRLFAFLKETEDCIADFTLARTPGEMLSACQNYQKQGIACICKPARGENAEGFFRFVSDEDYAFALRKGEISHYLCERQLTMLPQDFVYEIPRLVMPYLPGQEWDVDVLAWKGEIRAVTLRTNGDMFGGLSASSTTWENAALLDTCSRIIKKLDYSGLACLSFKEDETGHPMLLEINPRAMGTIHLSTLAGNNLVQQYLDLLEHEPAAGGPAISPVVTPAGFSTALYYDITPVKKQEIHWKKLSIDDKEIYEDYFRRMRTHITDLIFNCHFAWDNLFRIQWAIIEDCFVQISFCKDNAFVLMPFGEYDAEKLTRIMTLVREEFRSRGIPFRIACIDEAYLNLFKQLGIPHIDPDYDEDYADYLYDADKLRTLSGRKMAKKRGHLHRFLNLYPDYEYHSLTAGDLDDCLDCVKRWAANKDANLFDTDESDYIMIRRIFEHFDELQVKGGIIRIHGELAAFSIGSQVGHTAYIHFEKADISYDGIYAAINQLVLIHEFPEVQYVNREEDLGVPSLRKSKESYHPVRKVPKYRMPIL